MPTHSPPDKLQRRAKALAAAKVRLREQLRAIAGQADASRSAAQQSSAGRYGNPR